MGPGMGRGVRGVGDVLSTCYMKPMENALSTPAESKNERPARETLLRSRPDLDSSDETAFQCNSIEH